MIVMQEEEEVVDTKENKRFCATHGKIIPEVRFIGGKSSLCYYY